MNGSLILIIEIQIIILAFERKKMVEIDHIIAWWGLGKGISGEIMRSIVRGICGKYWKNSGAFGSISPTIFVF